VYLPIVVLGSCAEPDKLPLEAAVDDLLRKSFARFYVRISLQDSNQE
jgi:hypothetical protein